MKKHFNIADMYEMVADKVPSRDALVCGEQRATFLELEQRVRAILAPNRRLGFPAVTESADLPERTASPMA